MPSFFIIAFIWRGLIFPGSIFLTTLPYFYRCSVIKCKHLRAGKDRSAAGDEPIVSCNDKDLVPRADLRVRGNDVLCKRVLPLCHELRHVVPDRDPVTGRREDTVQPLRAFDPERQPPVGGTDGREADSFKEHLPDPAGRGEDEGAPLREKARPDARTELVVSDDLDPPQ
jgi:hypothetical protein